MSNKTYTLGATAPTLEMIRDFLRRDYENIHEAIIVTSKQVEKVTESLDYLYERLSELEEVALTLIEDIIENNAQTTVQVVSHE